MALNVKAALLICLGFTGAMCWLVSRVQRPAVELLTPGETNTRVVQHVADVTQRARGLESRGDFSRRSPIDRSRFDAAGAPSPRSEPVPTPMTPLPPAADERLAGAGPSSNADESGLLIARTDPWPPPIPIPAVIGGEPEPLDVEEDPAAPPPAAPTPRTVTVEKGDSVVRICRRLWSSEDSRYVTALIEANPELRVNPNRIYAGQSLVVPAVNPAVPPKSRPVETAIRTEAPPQPPRSAVPPARYYTVRRDDTLAGIARRELRDARRWVEIARLNGFKDANIIRPGMKIRLPEDTTNG